jgi:hypothetical protein
MTMTGQKIVTGDSLAAYGVSTNKKCHQPEGGKIYKT